VRLESWIAPALASAHGTAASHRVSWRLYHVTARGNGRQTIFADNTDRERFLLVLTSIVSTFFAMPIA